MSSNSPPPSDPIEPNSILIAEFQYIAQSAFQANEDRARVSNYYFVTAGAAVAAILSAQFQGTAPREVFLAFAVLFGTLGGIGFLTTLQLARLRRAWTDCALAMNRIKDYYTRRYPALEFDKAFLWTTRTLPPPAKLGSVAFLLALSVVFVSSVSVGAAVAYWQLFNNNPITDSVVQQQSFGAGVASSALQLLVYFYWLRR